MVGEKKHLWIGMILGLGALASMPANAQDLPSPESLIGELTSSQKTTSVTTPKKTIPKETSSDDAQPKDKPAANGLPPKTLTVPEVAPVEAAPAKPTPKKISAQTEPVKATPKTKPSVTQKPKTEAPKKVESKPATQTPEATKVAEPPTQTPPAKRSAQSVLPLRMVQSIFESLHEADRSKYVDLTPWLDSEDWWQAHAALREGKCSKGLKFAQKAVAARYPLAKGQDDSTRPREVQYALARFELCGGRQVEGRKTMQSLAHGKDGVALLAKRALGQSAYISFTSTKTKSTSKSPTPSLSSRIQHFEASLRTKGNLQSKTDVFDDLRGERLSRYQWERVTKAFAKYLERHKQIEDAGLLWRGLYLKTRHRKSSREVEREVVRFEKRHKVRLRTLDVMMDELRGLIVKKEYKSAKKLLVQNARLGRIKSSELKGWRLYLDGLIKERRRQRDDAVKAFEEADKLIKHPVARARLYSGWALALRRTNNDLKAVALYQRLCREFPQEHQLCAEALYQSGRLLQYENKLKEAYDAFFMLAGIYPESPRMAEVTWRAALCAYLLKRYDDVEPLLETIAQRWPNKRDASGLPIGLKAQYWKGVVALKKKDRDLATAHLQKTINMGPLTWYGRLAHARLKQMQVNVPDALPLSRLTLQDLNTLEGLRIPRDERMTMSAPLIRTGFYPEAYSEVSRYTYSKAPMPHGKEILAALKLALGEPDKAHWMARRLIRTSGPTANSLRTWATSFPLVHIKHIHKYAQAYKVNPMLVQAIMRQESGFRPKVKSYAGALGLMQLMPGTARYVARVFLDDNTYKRSHIFKPETNIKLGSMYIRLHVAFASDEVPLALAGYNAGPAPLKRWVKEYGDREMDAWVESITYKQARGYVRKVMTSYIAYSALYSPERMPTISLKVPKSLRKWGVVPGVGEKAVSSVGFKGKPTDALANMMLDEPLK